MIGKDFRKLVKFNLSVKGGGKEFVGLKGKEIGDKIKELEKRLYLGESYKNFTFGPDWIPTSLGQRKKMKRIHRKTNRSMREHQEFQEKKDNIEVLHLIQIYIQMRIQKVQYMG